MPTMIYLKLSNDLQSFLDDELDRAMLLIDRNNGIEDGQLMAG